MTARNGSAPARRAVTRWSLRLLRQEWRQQVVVIALITFAVFAAVLAATAAYNVVPSRDAQFGTASHRIDRRVTDPTAVDRYLRSARHWFGPVEIIGNRPVSVLGSTKAIDLRAQEIGGRFGAPMLAVRAGRLPASLGEVALTDDVASLLSASIGDKVTLGDSTYEVVGLVESPADLNDAFALTAPSPVRAGDLLSVLISADGKRVQTFRPATEPGTGALPCADRPRAPPPDTCDPRWRPTARPSAPWRPSPASQALSSCGWWVPHHHGLPRRSDRAAPHHRDRRHSLILGQALEDQPRPAPL